MNESESQVLENPPVYARLGFMELGMLAAALAEYAERPQDVTAYVRRIMEAGQEDES